MDYTRYRETAQRLIKKYGTVGSLTNTKQIIPDPTKKWITESVTSSLPIELVVFPDDGVTFVDHNVTGNVRVALVAPKQELAEVYIGDVVKYGLFTATVKSYKTIDPDGSGAILWALLIA